MSVQPLPDFQAVISFVSNTMYFNGDRLIPSPIDTDSSHWPEETFVFSGVLIRVSISPFSNAVGLYPTPVRQNGFPSSLAENYLLWETSRIQTGSDHLALPLS